MPDVKISCEKCAGYAVWKWAKGPEMHPGLLCPGGRLCSLLKLFPPEDPVTPREHADIDEELQSITTELEGLRDNASRPDNR